MTKSDRVMKYLPSIILLFAVVIVHLFLFAHLSDAASQSIEQLYERWTTQYRPWINGMGFVKDYIYISDSEFNLVRVAAGEFSFSGEGQNVKASLNLKGAEVFSFKYDLFYRDGLEKHTERNPLTVFFVEGDSESFIKKDSFCFTFTHKGNYRDGITVEVIAVALDDLRQKVYVSEIESYSKEADQFRLLSARKVAALWYDWEGILKIISLKQGAGSKDNLTFVNTKPMEHWNYRRPHPANEWKFVSFTGGLYLHKWKKMILFTKNHSVSVLDDSTRLKDITAIPYSAFFTFNDPKSSTAAPADEIRLNSLMIPLGVGVLSLLALFFYCACCGKAKKKVKVGRQNDIIINRVNRGRGGGGGGGGEGSSSNLASSVVADSSRSSAVSSAATSAAPSAATSAATTKATSAGNSASSSAASKAQMASPRPRTSPKPAAAIGKKKHQVRTQYTSANTTANTTASEALIGAGPGTSPKRKPLMTQFTSTNTTASEALNGPGVPRPGGQKKRPWDR